MSKFDISVAINKELERIGLCAFIFEDDIDNEADFLRYLEYLKKEQ